jgi:hypothetical protein
MHAFICLDAGTDTVLTKRALFSGAIFFNFTFYFRAYVYVRVQIPNQLLTLLC